MSYLNENWPYILKFKKKLFSKFIWSSTFKVLRKMKSQELPYIKLLFLMFVLYYTDI